MTPLEFDKLRKLELSLRRARTNIISRRTAKSKATGVGQHLRNGRITSEVPLERLFNTRKTLIHVP